jgi:hypothetical protein
MRGVRPQRHELAAVADSFGVDTERHRDDLEAKTRVSARCQ